MAQPKSGIFLLFVVVCISVPLVAQDSATGVTQEDGAPVSRSEHEPRA